MKNQTKNYKIKIVGVGDYGIRLIETLGEMPNVEYININTDWAFMGNSANQQLRIGKRITRGLGTGAHAKFGVQAAEEDNELISNSIKDGSLIIVVAGLGGGTGSGASPVVSKIAKELHIPTIAFVTSPFDLEGKTRCKTANDGIAQLKNVVDVLSVISIEKILESSSEYKKIPIPEFYLEVDEILRLSITNVIKYINSQVIKEKSMKNAFKLLKRDEIYNIICEDGSFKNFIEIFWIMLKEYNHKKKT